MRDLRCYIVSQPRGRASVVPMLEHNIKTLSFTDAEVLYAAGDSVGSFVSTGTLDGNGRVSDEVMYGPVQRTRSVKFNSWRRCASIDLTISWRSASLLQPSRTKCNRGTYTPFVGTPSDR